MKLFCPTHGVHIQDTDKHVYPSIEQEFTHDGRDLGVFTVYRCVASKVRCEFVQLPINEESANG